jgi:anti-sigma regulatory factor (Ser/Thr protein kinase)
MDVDSDCTRQTKDQAAWALTRGEWLPTTVRSITLDVAGGPRAAAEARHAVLERLGDLLEAPERLNFELLVSELVTNCVRHARMAASADLIKVHAAVAPDRLRLEVCDTGPGFAPGRPKVRELDEEGVGGMGLVLLDRLSSGWGVARGEGTFCVWAEFDRRRRAASQDRAA